MNFVSSEKTLNVQMDDFDGLNGSNLTELLQMQKYDNLVTG